MASTDELTPVIRQAVRDAIREEVSDRLDKLESQVCDLVNMKSTLLDHEENIREFKKGLDFTSKEISDIKDKMMPDLDKKFSELTTQICINILDIDTHRRKWAIIINGLQGDQGEKEQETRAKVRKFAKDKLKVTGVDSHPFSACHRLSPEKDAGIIIKFTDLSHRNLWLTSAKNLKGTNCKVSLSPDLHPCLRKLKKDVLQSRKILPPHEKNTAQVRYLPTWPYVCVKPRGKASINPRISKQTIVKDYLCTQ